MVTENPKDVLEEGAQIVADANKSPVEMLGHVTSSYYSPNLEKSIGLGVVKGGKNMTLSEKDLYIDQIQSERIENS